MTQSITIVYTPDAADQAIQANLWWIQNRPSAQTSLSDEIDRALNLLQQAPNLGKPRKHKAYKNLRKLVLSKIGYAIYYNYDEPTAEILVCAIWSGKRKRTPKL